MPEGCLKDCHKALISVLLISQLNLQKQWSSLENAAGKTSNVQTPSTKEYSTDIQSSPKAQEEQLGEIYWEIKVFKRSI